jgi:hypothetical protein
LRHLLSAELSLDTHTFFYRHQTCLRRGDSIDDGQTLEANAHHAVRRAWGTMHGRRPTRGLAFSQEDRRDGFPTLSGDSVAVDINRQRGCDEVRQLFED